MCLFVVSGHLAVKWGELPCLARFIGEWPATGKSLNLPRASLVRLLDSVGVFCIFWVRPPYNFNDYLVEGTTCLTETILFKN